MGLVMVFVIIIGFFAGCSFGSPGFRWYRKQNKRRNGGLGKVFYFGSFIGFATLAAIAIFAFPSGGHGGAPTGQDYNNLAKASFVLGASPGVGLLIGAIAVFIELK